MSAVAAPDRAASSTYRRRRLMNKVMMAVQKLGIPTGPAMVLTVPGRRSGKPRSTPMTPFEFDGGLYVVAGYPGADHDDLGHGRLLWI